jgi:myosin heavy subunit
MQKYINSRTDQTPHLYSQNEFAYKELIRTGNNQTLLFIGSSNSGKTFSLSESLRYYGETRSENLMDKINSMFNILNSFGGAYTIHNNTATRYVIYKIKIDMFI